ncbi:MULTISPECIES: hypothetical protein [unclassified Streptomyces]|uniref:hypothetical protein n=1 Tax=Streptomyces sp. NPDC127129 TaxID=3345373 RepID=UPI00363BCEB7
MPLAVVVLSRITSGQAKTLARAAALEQAREAAAQFRAALLAQFVSGDPASARSGLQTLVTACRELCHLSKPPEPLVSRMIDSQQLAAAVSAVNEGVTQVLKASAQGSRQRRWFHELEGYWRVTDAAVRSYADEAGLTPTQSVQISNALERLTSCEPQPFMRITADRGNHLSLYSSAKATIKGAAALTELLDELPALEQIGG